MAWPRSLPWCKFGACRGLEAYDARSALQVDVYDGRPPGRFVLSRGMINLSLETEALAQRLALAKHLTVEEAIRLALEDKARAEGLSVEPTPRDPSAAAVAARRARMDEIVRAVQLLPVVDRRPTQQLIDELNEL